MVAATNPALRSGDRAPHGGVPAWDEAYIRYRPLLFSALSGLAKHGFAASPDDGLDLIHDFFLDAWHPLVRNYDRRRAKFETYLYASFVRFARPRIIRLHRWSDALVEPSSLTTLDTAEVQVEPAETAERDIKAVRAATAKLDPFERELLITYVSSPRMSERDLAQRYSLTRYRLRMSLADALAKTAVYLGETSALDDAERSLILALWHEGRTVKQAAAVLKRPISEVQTMRSQFFHRLSYAVKGRDDTQAAAIDQPFADAEVLLASALKSGMSKRDVEAIRKNSELIINFLNDSSSQIFFERSAADWTPDHLAQLYDALGSDEKPDPDDAALLESLFEASAQDEREIGEAFAGALMPTLHGDLTKFSDRVFLGVPPIDEQQYSRLRSETSVSHGGEAAAELARFGVTPVTVVEASQGVANLARRFCDKNNVKKFGTFILDKAGRSDYSSKLVLPRADAVYEVHLMCELPKATAARLFDWLTRVAEYAPAVFDGFDAELRGDELRLLRTDESIKNLFVRWRARHLIR
jgi:RNA polymerase sigma factor (sigma-70 family)